MKLDSVLESQVEVEVSVGGNGSLSCGQVGSIFVGGASTSGTASSVSGNDEGNTVDGSNDLVIDGDASGSLDDNLDVLIGPELVHDEVESGLTVEAFGLGKVEGVDLQVRVLFNLVLGLLHEAPSDQTELLLSEVGKSSTSGLNINLSVKSNLNDA